MLKRVIDAPTNHPYGMSGRINPPAYYIMNFIFQAGNAQLVATGIVPSQTPNLAKVTFSNGQAAGVTISPAKLERYWNVLEDGNLSPKFLTAEGRLVPTFEVKNIGGTLMIVEAASNRPIVL